jgi:hypothetical protein
MPTSNFKLTITLTNGTLITYTTVGDVTETTDLKSFTGRRAGESGDGLITVHKDKIVDQKKEPA